jgi:hypothetical protein
MCWSPTWDIRASPGSRPQGEKIPSAERAEGHVLDWALAAEKQPRRSGQAATKCRWDCRPRQPKSVATERGLLAAYSDLLTIFWQAACWSEAEERFGWWA